MTRHMILVGLNLLMWLGAAQAQVPIKDQEANIASVKTLAVQIAQQKEVLKSCQAHRGPSGCQALEETVTMLRRVHLEQCRSKLIPPGTAECP